MIMLSEAQDKSLITTHLCFSFISNKVLVIHSLCVCILSEFAIRLSLYSGYEILESSRKPLPMNK